MPSASAISLSAFGYGPPRAAEKWFAVSGVVSANRVNEPKRILISAKMRCRFHGVWSRGVDKVGRAALGVSVFDFPNSMSQYFAIANRLSQKFASIFMKSVFDYSAVINRILERNRWGTERKLAEALGITANTWTAYKRGARSFGLNEIAKICDLLNVTPGWLLGLEGQSQTMEILPSGAPGSVAVPRYEVRASAGAGALVVAEDPAEFFSVGRDWLRRNLPPWAPANATVGVLDGSGDSMEPTIRDGDTLMIVRDVPWRTVERGGIFVLSLDDRLLLKRLQVMDNGDLRVISDNRMYEAFTVPMRELGERVIIEGQVFFVGGRPRSF